MGVIGEGEHRRGEPAAGRGGDGGGSSSRCAPEPAPSLAATSQACGRGRPGIEVPAGCRCAFGAAEGGRLDRDRARRQYPGSGR